MKFPKIFFLHVLVLCRGVPVIWGTKLRVFRVPFRAPFLPPFFPNLSLQGLFTDSGTPLIYAESLGHPGGVPAKTPSSVGSFLCKQQDIPLTAASRPLSCHVSQGQPAGVPRSFLSLVPFAFLIQELSVQDVEVYLTFKN